MEKLLHEIWYDPTTGYTSAAVLYQRARERNSSVTQAGVKEWLAKQRTAQLHVPARKAKSAGHILSGHVNQRWQADLIDMSKYPSKKMLWILVVVDVFSRKLYARALPSKHAGGVAEEFISVIKEAGETPSSLDTDQGGEFGKLFDSEVLGSDGPTYRHHRALIGDHRALGIIDATIRVFKNLIFKLITDGGEWAPQLKHLVKNLNSTKRPALLGYSPDDVLNNIHIQAELGTINHEREMAAYAKKADDPPYAVGDKVRVPAQGGPFKRGFKQQMTEKAHPITKVNSKSVEVSVDGQIRRYLFAEIAQTGVPLEKDVFEVEKVLRSTRTITRGKKKNIKQKLVKFKGYDEPEWVDESDIIQ